MNNFIKHNYDIAKIIKFMSQEKHVSFSTLLLLFNYKSKTSLTRKIKKLLDLGLIRKELIPLDVNSQLTKKSNLTGKRFFLLTRKGAEYCAVNYEIKPKFSYDRYYTLSINQIAHTEFVQSIRALYENKGYFTQYLKLKNVNVMDLYVPKIKVAIEVELTIKSKKDIKI